MTAYKIFQQGQSVQVLHADGQEVARMLNGVKGWQAYHSVKTDRMSSLGPIYETVGEGVNVSRLINQHDAAEQIAKVLEL